MDRNNGQKFCPNQLIICFFYSCCLIYIVIAMNAAHAAAATSCVSATDGWTSMQEKKILLINDRGKKILLLARIADDPPELAAGYQFICPDVISNSAILFDFGRQFTSRFHMRDVFAPLDIAFFNQSGKLVNVVYMTAEPPGFSGRRKLYAATAPYRYALETPAGYLADHHLTGTRIRLVPESVH